MLLNSRIQRERNTVQAMMRMYCKDLHHTPQGLCPDCNALSEYADKRLDVCPYEDGKTTCAKCPIHCYKPEMREKIRTVMRYAGPKMIWRHPILAIFHFIDGRRKAPTDKKR